MNKKLQKIISEIYEMDGIELESIIDAVKLRRNQLHTSDAHKFTVGDRVSFAGRHGSTLKGVVEKVKIKEYNCIEFKFMSFNLSLFES